MNRPIRVLHILEATSAGTRRWIEDVIRGLDRTHVEQSCIVAVRREPSFLDSVAEFRDMGINVWIVDMIREISPIRDAAALWHIVRILRSHPFDVIHGHSSKGGMLARLAGRAAGVGPVVYTPHAFAFLGRYSAAPLYRLLERKVKRLTDRLLAVSDAEADIAVSQLGYTPAQVTVVYNGTQVGRALDTPNHAMVGDQHIGMVAGLRPQKDPDVFLETCAILHQRRKNLRFSLCGKGPLEAKLRTKRAQLGLDAFLNLPGHVPNAREVIRVWNVFVLCSQYEGLPYALIEAMAEGKPVVATRVPGIEEVVVDGITGFLVPPGNPRALADAVEHVLDNRGLAAQMGIAGLQRVATRYSLDRQLDELKGFYRNAAEMR